MGALKGQGLAVLVKTMKIPECLGKFMDWPKRKQTRENKNVEKHTH